MKIRSLALVWLIVAIGGACSLSDPPTFETVMLSPQFHAEGAAIGDINRDGQADAVAGPYWYEGPRFKKKHEIYPPTTLGMLDYSQNFTAYVHEFNGDDRPDVLVIGFPGREARLYLNPGVGAGHWPVHEVFHPVNGESPVFADLSDDGRPQLIGSVDGRYGYAWPDWAHPNRTWRFTTLSDSGAEGRFEHDLGVGDVNGDGRSDLLTRTAWYEQPPSQDGKSIWERHPIHPEIPDAAQMELSDLDGDGDMDLITAIHCHAYGLGWYEQVKGSGGAVTWKRRFIMGEGPQDKPFGVSFSQPHAVVVVDVDRDGIDDILAGKRVFAHNGKDPGAHDPAVLYWFQTRRTKKGVVFVPHLIHADSGVGTQFAVGDLNGDGKVDILTSNKKGTFVHLQR